MITPENIKTWIEANLANSQVYATGDGRHFEAIVIDAAFAGKNTLARHRMVYDALGERMQADIHALSLKTFTPEEYEKR